MRRILNDVLSDVIIMCYIFVFTLFIPIIFLEAIIKGFIYGRKHGKIQDKAEMEEFKKTLFFYQLFFKIFEN